MPSLSTKLLALAIFLVSASFTSAVLSQKPDVPLRNLAVDVVKTKTHILRGLILEKQENKTVIAVDRTWLKAAYPNAFEGFKKQETKRLATTLAQYEQRFKKWIDHHRDNEVIFEPLRQELKRIEDSNSPEAMAEKQFMLIHLEKGVVKKTSTQSANRRRTAAIAWQRNLKNISVRSYNNLRDELLAAKVDIPKVRINLADQLEATRLTGRQWSIRQSMFEFQILGEMEFHGQGEMFMRKSEQPNFKDLIMNMAAQSRGNSIKQLGKQLGLPEFNSPNVAKTDWTKKLTQQADTAKVRSILVKRIIEDLDNTQVTVEVVFLAKIGDQWAKIKTTKAKSRLADQNEQELEALENDPQLQAALQQMKALGLGNSNLMKTALQKGAATRQALESANEEMGRVLSYNTFSLDGPFNLN